MGKYDNVTMKEYMKKKKKMLNNLGRLKGQCIGLSCSSCPFYDLNCNEVELENPDKALEIVMEYEKETDFSKIENDTKILVTNHEEDCWHRRYFAGYYNGIIYTYPNGLSSFTYDSDTDGTLVPWKYAKLYKGDK